MGYLFEESIILGNTTSKSQFKFMYFLIENQLIYIKIHYTLHKFDLHPSFNLFS